MRIQAAAICALIGSVLLFSPVSGHAQTPNGTNQTSVTNVAPCDVTTPNTGSTVTQCAFIDQDHAITCPPGNNCISAGAQNPSVSSTSGLARLPVDVWNYCRYVDNTTNGVSPIFVPFNTSTEWMSFINAWDNNGAIKNYSNLLHCARPFTPPTAPGPQSLPPDTNPASLTYCNSPVLQTPPAELHYTRTDFSAGALVTDAATYQCTDNACATPTWTEQATGQYQPGDSDPGSANNTPYGWYLAGPVSYSPAAPLCVAGQCGADNGVSSGPAPSANLCGAGNTASGVSNSGGTWSWTCVGDNGGTTATCSAPAGGGCTCGPDNGVATATPPALNGECSGFGFTGPGNGDLHQNGSFWNWSCGGGLASACFFSQCSAPMAVTACGLADGLPDSNAPWTDGSNLCSTGTSAASESTDGVNWSWSCNDATTGTSASCTAPVNQLCGCGSAVTVATATAPTSNFCNSGDPLLPNTLAQQANGTWSWTCAGTTLLGCPASTQCSTPPYTVANGQCGATRDACTAGNYAVDDSNDGTNYHWTCNGTNGGTNASCSAPMPGTNGQCGSANGVPDTVPSWQNNGANICSAGGGTNGSTNGTSWTWDCNGSNGGTTAHCSAPAATDGACGADNGAPDANAPWVDNPSNLCAAGNGNNGSNNGSSWTWTCDGINGGGTASCSAPMGGVCVDLGVTYPMPACGASGLTCNSGYPSIGFINLSGQWLCDIAPGGVGAGSSPCAVTCP